MKGTVQKQQGPTGQTLLDFPTGEKPTLANYVGEAGDILGKYLRQEDEVYRFIYIWGQPSSGKTHLIQAACQYFIEAGLATANYKAGAVAAGSLMVSPADLVCVDDIDQLAGEARGEEALFDLVNDADTHAYRLLVSGTQPPARTEWALRDLATRMIRALPLETSCLNDTEKLQLLGVRARRRGLSLSEEAGRYILSRNNRELGQLLNALDKLDRESLIAQRMLTIPFIKKTLRI